MAARKEPACYVYLIHNSTTALYVGKGSGRRGSVSARKYGGELKILEDGLSDDEAFDRERHWIAELEPEENKCQGGNGGRVKPKRKPPRPSFELEMERVGTRVYAARFLLTKLNHSNCEQWGVSKVDVNRLREVANG